MELGWETGFLLGAAIAAGVINVIAGGGGLLVFPSLLLVDIAPISANATSAAGIWLGTLVSGFAYRRELQPVGHKLWPITLITMAGSAVGAGLLLKFSDDGFAVVVPYLVALSTLLFAVSPQLARLSLRHRTANAGDRTTDKTADKTADKTTAANFPAQSTQLNQPMLLIGQGFIATYGGFFGGGAGILMLTLLSLTTPGKLQTLQAIKIWMALCINAIALAYFTVAGIINWPYALIVAAGTSMGGYGSVAMAKRLPAVWLRRGVIAIGVSLSIYFFSRG
ncbi:MAG: sulfite exporter TauE/SafE family protein [Cyanobacteria bacterium P01_A01_bin.116]